MLVFSFFIHIITIQFFILLQHPLISLVQSLFLLLLHLHSLSLSSHNRNLINDMMRHKSSPYTLYQRRLMHLYSMNLPRIAIHRQLTMLRYIMTATVYQKSLWRWRNKITMHSLTICKMSLRLIRHMVTYRLSIFCIIQFLNSHLISLPVNHHRLNMCIVTYYDSLLLMLFFPRR